MTIYSGNARLNGAALLAALFFAACSLTAKPAFAQASMPGSAGAMGGGSNMHPHSDDEPTEHAAPPPALPGSQARPATAAPSSKPATDMSPNDALFDAIDRGDVSAARDAISRGADINAHNVLGMTPLELSVDLGRNDISFLLLSLRQEFEQDRHASSPPPRGGKAGKADGDGDSAAGAKQARRRHSDS